MQYGVSPRFMSIDPVSTLLAWKFLLVILGFMGHNAFLLETMASRSSVGLT